jgi:hypothetical protein
VKIPSKSGALPVWLISTTVGAVLLSPVAVYLALRRPPPPPYTSPPTVVVSVCRDPSPGVRRAGFDIKFDVPEGRLALHSGFSDMPPGERYGVTVKQGSEASLEIWECSVFDEKELQVWPVFSDHVEERAVRSADGHPVGYDRWGYWKDYDDGWGHGKGGKHWRRVKFGREEVGYPPTLDREAQLFDQVISSACLQSTAAK